jgi:nucleotide-binding universal stress UspA family protein
MSESPGAVVVGVDGSAVGRSAACWAAGVAATYGSPLHVVYALPSFGRNVSESAAAVGAALMSYQRDCADAYLREAAQAVRSRHPDVDISTVAVKKPVDEALVQFGRRARMVVVGNTQVTPAAALFVGSTTLAVATHATCPVVAWRGTNDAPTDQPVVVGTDGTQSSLAALDAAFELADAFDAKLSAVRSWAAHWPATAVTNPFFADLDALEAAQWAELADAVDRANQRHPQVDASCFVEPGEPAAALLHQVEAAGAQLVAVGSRGRNSVTAAILGSTALNLLNDSIVPVMICRARHGARSPMCSL